MISYDNYKNRIEKLAKAKRVVHKLRFLIAGVLALIVAGSIGLMVAKGSYMSETALSASTVYFNEDYEVTPAKAFLASAKQQRVEYSPVGGEWTEEKPVKAGTYLARTVSPKLVGHSYSQPVEFTILPLSANFEITGDSVVYGNVPEYRYSGIVSSQKIDEESLVFDYQSYGEAQTQVDVNGASVKVIDKVSGEDFTSCYEFTFTGKNLTVSNRKIEVRAEERAAVYNGAEQAYTGGADAATRKMLANGDEITLQTSLTANGVNVSSPIDAGDYGVKVNSVTVMHGDKDVTARYDITYLTSVYKIAKREITVEGGSGSKEYDGKPLVCEEFMYENVAEGHAVSATADVSLTDAGKVKNNLKIAVFALDGMRDVTENYDIKFTAGTLEVTPRKITVTTPDAEKIYDGTPLSDMNFTVSGAPEGFIFSYVHSLKSERTEYGTQDNEFTVSATYNGTEVSSENFDITYDYGTLSVKKREITVKTATVENYVFDGGYHSDPYGFNISVGSLVDGHSLTVDFEAKVRDVSSEFENNTTYLVFGSDGDVSVNYDITYDNGSYTVLPRPITVTSATPEPHVYDGVAFSDSGYETASEYGFGLVEGDTLECSSCTEITDVSVKDNVCVYVCGNNYTITEVIYGKLTVIPRPLTVTTADGEWEYDGDPHENTGYEAHYITADGERLTGLVNAGEKLTVKFTRTITDYGEHLNDCSYEVPSVNYEIVESGYNYGTLKITPRRIILNTLDGEWVYDGEEHSQPEYKTYWKDDEKQTGLLNGDTLVIDTNKIMKASVAGPYDNTFDINEAATPNYKIVEKRWGKLVITPRPLTVKTATDDKVYDGDPLENTGYETFYIDKEGNRLKGLVIDGEALVLKSTKTITNVGEVKNECVFDAPNGNYTVLQDGYEYGTLTVTARPLRIEVLGASWTYDGEEHFSTAYKTSRYFSGVTEYLKPQAGLIGDDELTVVESSINKILNWGEATNLCEYTFPEFEEGKSNYVLGDYVRGKIAITQREIDVTINSDTKVYDGIPLKNDGYTTAWIKATDGDNANGLIGDDELNVNQSTVPSITEKGECDNVFAFTLPEFEKGKSNYILHNTVNGKLTVTARPLTITTAGGDKPYDGTPLTKPDAEKCVYTDKDGKELNGLVLSHKLKPVDGTVTSVTNVFDGEVVNGVEYRVYDGETDVTANYEITEESYIRGKLKITPAPLGITLKPVADIVYGETATYPEHVENTGVNGETVKIGVTLRAVKARSAAFENLAAGEYEAVLDLVKCTVSKDGNTIARGIENYTVNGGEETKVAFKVTPREVEITVGNGSKTYGDDLPQISWSLTDKKSGTADYTLPYGEELTFTYLYEKDGGKTDEPIHAGNYKVIADETTFKINESADGVANYIFTQPEKEGTASLDINRRKVSLTLDKQTVTYGEKYGVRYYDPKMGKDLNYSFAEGSEHWAYNDNVILEVETDVPDPVKAGSYTVTAVTATVQYVTYFTEKQYLNNLLNYELTCENGVLLIEKRTLTVGFNSLEFTYGDEELLDIRAQVVSTIYSDGAEYTVPEADAEKLEINFLFYKEGDTEKKAIEEPINAGRYIITLDSVLYDGNSDDLVNFVIDRDNCVDGLLEIKRKEISVEIESKSLEYGQTVPMTSNDYFLIENGNPVHNGTLCYGEVLKLSVIYFTLNGADETTDDGITPRNAGNYTVKPKSFAVLKDGVEIKDGEKNYIIHCEGGTLEITPKAIEIVLSAVGNQTYGTYLMYPNSMETNGVGNYANTPALGYEETLHIAVKFKDAQGSDVGGNKPKNAGFYSLELDRDNCIFYEKDKTTEVVDGVDNYTITCSPLENLEIKRKAINICAVDRVEDLNNALVYGEFATYEYPKGDDSYGKQAGYIPEMAFGERIEILKVVYTLADGSVDVVTPRNVGIYSVWLADNVGTIAIENTGCVAVYSSEEDGGELIEGGLNNYELTYWNGNLQIVQKEITVTPSDMSVTYGDEIAYPEKPANYEAAEGIQYGEKLQISVEFINENEIFNVGTYKIKMVDSFTVFESDGETEVEGGFGNYKIVNTDANLGTLTVTKRGLQLNLLPDKFNEFYGNALNKPEAEKISGWLDGGELPNDDVLTFTYYYENTVTNKRYNAGDTMPAASYLLKADKFMINGAELTGAETENYTVSELQPYTVTVDPRPITVVLNAIAPVVYGNRLSYAAGIGNYGNTPDLAYGERLEIAVAVWEDGTEISELKDAGTYTVMINLRECKVYNADDDNSPVFGIANYYVICDTITAEIKCKEITVSIADLPAAIYGDEIGTNSYTVISGLDGSGMLPYGETLDFVYRYTKLGEKTEEDVTPKDAGSYSIWIDTEDYTDWTVDGDPAEHKNYNITLKEEDYGSLTINKKVLNIKFDKEPYMSSTYGNPTRSTIILGTWAKYADTEKYVLKIAYDEHVGAVIGYYDEVSGKELDPKTEVINAGTYKIKVKQFIIYREALVDGNPVSGGEQEIERGTELTNYKISCADGTFKITKRKIYVEISQEHTATYGEALPAVDYKTMFNGHEQELPYGDRKNFDILVCYYAEEDVGRTQPIYEPQNAGTYIMVLEEAYINESNVLANYEIDFDSNVDGKLVISKRDITVKTFANAASVIYGTPALPENGFEITAGLVDGNLPHGDVLEVSSYKYTLNGEEVKNPQNAGTYLVEKDAFAVTEGNKSVENYNIDWQAQPFEITRRALTVEISDQTFTYGDSYKANEIKVTAGLEDLAGKMPYNEKLVPAFRYSYGGLYTYEPREALTYTVETEGYTVDGGNRLSTNYNIDDSVRVAKLVIDKREISSIELCGGNTPAPFAYGENYASAITEVKIEGLAENDSMTSVAVIYAPAASTFARMRSARAAEEFTPKKVGFYTATLDWNNCEITNEEYESLLGGLNNYKLPDGFVMPSVSFQIVKKNITVTISDDSCTYGDSLPDSVLADGKFTVEDEHGAYVLPDGEKLKVTAEIVAEDGGAVGAAKKKYTYKYKSAAVEGGDIGNYTVTPVDGDFIINARDINITFTTFGAGFGEEYAYPDGLDNAEVDNLAADDRIKVSVKYRDENGDEYAHPTSAGVYDIILDSFEIYTKGKLVPNGDKNYNVLSTSGKFTIANASVHVKANDARKTYDGSPLVYDIVEHGYTVVSGELHEDEGYSIVVDKADSYTDATTGVDNKTTFAVYKDGKPTKDIVATVDGYGRFIIDKMAVNVNIGADGAAGKITAQYGEKFNVGFVPEKTLPDDITFTATKFNYLYLNKPVGVIEDDKYFIINAGNYVIDAVSPTATGDKKDNYIFTYNTGSLEVTKREIVVESESKSFVYTGSPNVWEEYKTFWAKDGGLSGLLGEDELTVTSNTKVTDVVEGVDNILTYSLSSSLKKNYIITKSDNYGTLSVTKKDISVSTNGIEADYDGKTHCDETLNYDEAQLVSGHKLTVVKRYEVTDATVDPDGNYLNGTVENKPEIKILSGTQDVTANYNIASSYGEVKIKQLKIEVTTPEIKGIYNGAPHLADDITKYAVSGTLAEGQQVVIDALDRSAVHANIEGEKRYNQTTVTVEISATGDGVGSNYVINYTERGEIVISPATVTVTLPDGITDPYGANKYAEKIEQGTAYSGFIAGESLKISLSYSETPVNHKSYTAQLVWNKCTVNNGLLTDYALDEANSVTQTQFEITALDFNVASATPDIEYGATPKTSDILYSPVYGEQIEISISYTDGKGGNEVKKVGEYSVTYSVVKVTGGNADVNNYNFIYKMDGVLNVKPKNITISPIAERTVKYADIVSGGEIYPENTENYESLTPSTAHSERIQIVPEYWLGGKKLEGKPQFAGTYEVKVGGIIVYGADGKTPVEGGAGNYNPTTGTEGKLVVEGILLTVTLNTVEKEYDGTRLTLKDTVTNEDLGKADSQVSVAYSDVNGSYDRLPGGYVLKLVSEVGTPDKNVCTVDNTARYALLDGEGNAAGEYEIIHNDNGAKLKITRKEVTVSLADNATAEYGEEVSLIPTLSCGSLPGSEIFRAEANCIGKNGEVYPNAGEYTVQIDESTVSVAYGSVENYNFKYTTGNLTVLKRRILITTATSSREYDGTAYVNSTPAVTHIDEDGNAITGDGLVNGDTLTVTSAASVTNVAEGSVRNVCTYSVPANYEPQYEYGRISVTARRIVVKTAGGTKVYDGTPLVSTGNYTAEHENGGAGLIGDDKLQLIDGTKNSITNVGTVDDYCRYNVPNANYEIVSYTDGKLSVTQKDVTVTLTVKDYPYGTKNIAQDIIAGSVISGLENDEELILALLFNGSDALTPENCGEYTVSIDKSKLKVTKDGAEVDGGVDNYNIICTPETFAIVKGDVSVKLDKWAKETYNGTEHSYAGGYSVISGEFADGESIATVKVKCYTDSAHTNEVSPVNAGTYYVVIDAANSVMSNGTKLSDNYNVDVSGTDITFVIDKAALSFEFTENYSKVFTGDNPFADCGNKSSGAFTVSGLIEGEELKLTLSFSQGGTDVANPVNAGTYHVTVSAWSIYYEGSDEKPDGKDNYTVSALPEADFEISKRVINVAVNDRIIEGANEESDINTLYGVNDLTVTDERGVDDAVFESCKDQFTTTFAIAYKGLDENGKKEYTVSVSLGGDITDNFDAVSYESGSLKFTDRWVEVELAYSGAESYIYSGEAISSDLFSVKHLHMPDKTERGFLDDSYKDHVVLTFTDGDGNSSNDYPADAGKYTVTFIINGYENYLIDYADSTVEFEILPREVKFEIEVDRTEFVYTGVRPEFNASATYAEVQPEDGGFIGAVPEADKIEVILVDANNNVVTDYNFGSYTLAVKFDGMKNYRQIINRITVEILKRKLVITPVLPEGLVLENKRYVKDYDGNDLTLAAGIDEGYRIRYKDGLGLSDGVAENQILTITSNAVTAQDGTGELVIKDFTVIDASGNNVSDNYKVVFNGSSENNSLLQSLGIGGSEMYISVGFRKFNVTYRQSVNGGEYNYGDEVVHEIKVTAKDAITVDSNSPCSLYAGHKFAFAKTEISFGTSAGVYTDWLSAKKVLTVVDGNRNDVSKLYNLTCVNPDENAVEIKRHSVKLNINVTAGELKDALKNGNDAMLTVSVLNSKLTALNGSLVSFADGTGLLNGDSLEVYAFIVGEDLVLGACVFNGTKSMTANYEITANAIEGVQFKAVTKEEALNLAKPLISITFDGGVITETALLYGEITGAGGIKGFTKLNSGYTLIGLKDGHTADIIVYRHNGSYALGVVIYVSATGKDASSQYNLPKLSAVNGISVSYITVTNLYKCVRELRIDMDGVTVNAEGAVTIDGDNITGFETDSIITVTSAAEAVGSGYELTVTVKNKSGKDMTGSYYILVKNLPANVTVTNADLTL